MSPQERYQKALEVLKKKPKETPKAPVVIEVQQRKRRPGEHNRAFRWELIQEDPYCYYCGAYLTLDTSTLDHAIPKSRGGRTCRENCVLACYECNHDKQDKVLVPWNLLNRNRFV